MSCCCHVNPTDCATALTFLTVSKVVCSSCWYTVDTSNCVPSRLSIVASTMPLPKSSSSQGNKERFFESDSFVGFIGPHFLAKTQRKRGRFGRNQGITGYSVQVLEQAARVKYLTMAVNFRRACFVCSDLRSRPNNSASFSHAILITGGQQGNNALQ